MILGAVQRDAEAIGDLLVRQAEAEEVEDFALAGGEGAGVAASHRERIVVLSEGQRTTRKVVKAPESTEGTEGHRRTQNRSG